MNQFVSLFSSYLRCEKDELSCLVLDNSTSIMYHNSIFRWIFKTDGRRFFFPKEGYKSYYSFSINSHQSLKPHLMRAYEIAKSFSMIEEKPQINRK